MKSSVARPLLVGLLLANVAGCSSPRSTTMNTDSIDSYAMAAVNRENGNGLGSEARAEAVSRWQALLADLSATNVKGKVAEVYATDAFFNDW